jgi:glucose/arabinose dehydrogenase
MIHRRAALALSLSLALGHPLFAATLPPGFSETIVASVSQPTGFVFTPDGRLLILEKTGAIRVVKNRTLLPAAAATLALTSNGERGLLGIALDPAFAATGHLFVY